MNVLSLFDGVSACHLALTRAGFEVGTYYTSEIDKYATKISEKNYPEAVRLGDVTKWEEWVIDWNSIDLVTGGFPCQAWSVAGKQLGDKDPRGMLFWTMLDVMKMVLKHNPKAKFLMENVKMKKEFEGYITHHTEQALGHVEKHLINLALVSAQNRQRYYWTNIQGITQPEDKGLILADVIESGFSTDEMTSKNNKSHCITARYSGAVAWNSIAKRQRSMILDAKAANTDKAIKKPLTVADIGKGGISNRVYSEKGKSPTLTTMTGGHREPKVLIVPEATKKGYTQIEPGQCVDLTFPNSKTRRGRKMADKSNCLTAANHEYSHWNGLTYRKLTPLECERLQTFPDGYTEGVSNTQRYKALGNAWTVDVIAHIFSFMDKKAEVVTLDKGLFIPSGTQLSLEFYQQINNVAVA
jgi:DNA-cytosine methyltransferase